MSDKLTLIQDLQMELYQLLNKHIFSLDGFKMQGGDTPPELFIAKSVIVEAGLKLLNEFGESLTKDERLVNNDDNN